MAKKNGWWSLDCDVELDDCDLEHIGNLIKEGFTSGEVLADYGEGEE